MIAILVAPALTAAQEAEPRVDVGIALPSWVEPMDVPAPQDGADGIEMLLRDEQWRVDATGSTQFVRNAYRIRTTVGMHQASELGIVVSSDQHLALHHVMRTREGTTTDILSPDDVRVIQRESRLGEGLYDESRTALMFLEDVRVGDIIEYAYSRVDRGRLLGGRFAHGETLAAGATRALRFVVRWPAGRAIAVRLHRVPPDWTVEESATSVRLEARDVAEPERSADAPAWFDPLPRIELSEFRDWADVAAWDLPHQQVEDPVAALAEVPMDRLRAASSARARASAALRFVQDEIRYLGLEVGERALVPHAPQVVAYRRYGDCKDKALLLVTILRALGIDADVALVHSARGRALDEALPSPLAFDHVVVHARIDGASYWMDATRTHERGPLDALPPLRFERALVVRADTRGLTELPAEAPEQADLEVEERFVVVGLGATLHVDTVLRGSRAAATRAALEDEGTEGLGERYLAYYRARDMEPRIATPVQVEENEDGSLRVREHYHVVRYWQDHARDVTAWAVADMLERPEEGRPNAPLWLPHRAHVHHRVVVEDEAGWAITPSVQRVSSHAFDLSQSVTVNGRRLAIDARVRVLADHVAAEDVDAYANDVERAERVLGFEVIDGTRTEAQPTPADAAPALACLGAIVLLAMGSYGWSRFVDGRRRRAFRARQVVSDGETAAAAILVSGRDDARERHRPVACCGRSIEGGEWTRALLGGVPLHIHAGRCAMCGETKRRYYREASRS